MTLLANTQIAADLRGQTPQAPTPPPAFAGLASPGFSIAYNDAAGLLAVGCEDGSIHLWPSDHVLGIRSGRQTPTILKAHGGPVTALAWCGALLASGGTDAQIIFWNGADREPLHKIDADGTVRAFAVSPDGKLVASAGDDSVIHLWDPATGKPVGKLEGHADWVAALSFTSDGKRLASGGYDGTVKIWDVDSRRKLVDISTVPPVAPGSPVLPATAVLCLAFSPDDSVLAIGGNDSRIQFVNPADGRLGRALVGHGSSVTGLVFHPSGTMLAASGRDNTVRLWSLTDGKAIKTHEGHTGWVQGLALVGRGTHLASVSADQTVRVWEMK